MPAVSESSTPIDRDLACARCGYNLRTLNPADACPECGLPLAESIAPAPREWVRRQYLGVWIQCLSYLLAAVAIIGEMYRSYVPALSPAAMMALRVAPLVGVAIAVWLLTTPRPHHRARASTTLVRYGFAMVLLLALVLPGVEHAGFKTTFGRVGWTLFFGLLVVCWIGLGCIQVRIARTLGLPLLGVFIWIASIVWSIGLAATALFYVFREFTQQSLFSRAEPMYVYTLLVGGVLIVSSSLLLAVAFTARPRMTASAPEEGKPTL